MYVSIAVITAISWTDMTNSSLALIIYNPNPPPAFMFYEMLRDINVFEYCVLQAEHPHELEDVISELQCTFATMHYLGDWSLSRRVQRLMRRARDISNRLSAEYVDRCACLLAACRQHQHSLLCRTRVYGTDCPCRYRVPSSEPLPPSYDAMSLAIAACDDVLPYLSPLCRSRYLSDYRPCLVAFMADPPTDDCESDSDGGASMDLPAAKRWCE